jgi:hypothetical protein
MTAHCLHARRLRDLLRRERLVARAQLALAPAAEGPQQVTVIQREQLIQPRAILRLEVQRDAQR